MATTKKQAPAKSGNAPAKVFRARGVKVAVFENLTETDGREVKFYKITVQKIYKEDAEFKTTNSLGRDDLPVARHLMQQAWVWVMEQESAPIQGDNEQETT
jgi:hypothetical protein